jgi:hypothetical protein
VTVSDYHIRCLLAAIAGELGRNITVHSGDRHKTLSVGAGSKSHHLDGRAADFHVTGMLDEDAFDAIMERADQLPTFPNQRFNLIRHGPYTETEGPHLHLGHYRILEKHTAPYSMVFRVEGLTAETSKIYSIVGHSSTKCYPHI